ncbi:MAG TPA: SUMF1/EgtB/PvdO family nonheme iron enzyme [Fimbriimonadaceae bacterium]|nr:SUMF1/EgtB/PvdO family nonheme iron enzyme [Fimbriimonadaceae bacterium]HRJ97680.1 SUMF1/EgtB/PvdO family nonheme iron enzyme [Fimbriimonadaceae bacterium]
MISALALSMITWAGLPALPAQPGRAWFTSLEWAVASSTLIVKGKIAFVKRLKSSYGGDEVVFKVDETLKGEPQKEVAFAARFHGAPFGVAQKWMESRKELLVFLVGAHSLVQLNKAVAEEPYVYAPLNGRAEHAMFELDPKAGVQILSMAMEPLSKPRDILNRVRDAIPLPKPASMTSLKVPMDVQMPPFGHTGMGAVLDVPIDSRLEALAKGWTRSKKGRRRVLGVEALAQFKSTKNIDTVKALLDDRFEETWGDARNGKTFMIRPVREAAKDVLDSWDIPWEPVHEASIQAAREMIRIPAGEFIAGGTKGADHAGPERKVHLDEFWIGKTTVTVGQFRAFCKVSDFKYDWVENRPYRGWRDDCPMTMVTWDEARAFCQWAGGDLPTEDQWEKAARGTDGRRYPWGNEPDPSRLHIWPNTYTSWRGTAPVGSYPTGASPYGCLDMVGNVFQWLLGGTPTARPSRGGSYQEDLTDLRFLQPAGKGSMHGEGRIDSQGFRVAATKKLRLP